MRGRPVVLLTPAEMAWAELMAQRRRMRARALGRTHKGEMERRGIEWEIMGMMGEAACQSFWGLRHEHSDRLDGETGDVLGRHVRTTRTGGGLVVRPEEVDHLADAVMVLVYDRRPEMEIVGWAYGREAVQTEFWRADWPAPAWCLPGRLTKAIETVPDG